MPGHVTVVTDSAACLTGDLARQHRVLVVPLRVLAGEQAVDDRPAPLPDVIEQQLRAGRRLSTARPAPDRFAAAYAAAAAAGATAVVSVHLSGQLSGAISSATLAAASASVPVIVIDSRSIGMGLGLAVLAAARAASAGQGADDVAGWASRCAAQLGSFFACDTPDLLRAGGRLGGPAGPQSAGPQSAGQQSAGPQSAGPQSAGQQSAGPRGSALTARPLLHVKDGRIAILERVRTLSAAAARLEELAAGFAAGRPVDVGVVHLGHAARAARLAGRLAVAIPRQRHAYLAEAGAAIWAHTGPGMLGVAIAPC
jgi:fatty acid-binding protein DegV